MVIFPSPWHLVIFNGGLMGFFMVISWRFNQQKPGMLVDIASGYD